VDVRQRREECNNVVVFWVVTSFGLVGRYQLPDLCMFFETLVSTHGTRGVTTWKTVRTSDITGIINI
jgi:hypothetical protein